jgi:hypothetical protein
LDLFIATVYAITYLIHSHTVFELGEIESLYTRPVLIFLFKKNFSGLEDPMAFQRTGALGKKG